MQDRQPEELPEELLPNKEELDFMLTGIYFNVASSNNLRCPYCYKMHKFGRGQILVRCGCSHVFLVPEALRYE